MRDVYIIGAFSTAFGKKPDASFKGLTREAYLGLLADAGLETGAGIETGWFSNCGMGSWGQRNIRGQVCFTPGPGWPVPRTGADDQCGGRLRLGDDGLVRRLQGRGLGRG